MHACFQLGLSAVQTSEPMSKTPGNTLLVLLLCNVSYCILTTVSGYMYSTYRIIEKCIVAGLHMSIAHLFTSSFCIFWQEHYFTAVLCADMILRFSNAGGVMQ